MIPIFPPGPLAGSLADVIPNAANTPRLTTISSKNVKANIAANTPKPIARILLLKPAQGTVMGLSVFFWAEAPMMRRWIIGSVKPLRLMVLPPVRT